MFYINKIKRERKISQLLTIFKSYDLKTKFKIDDYVVCMYFPEQKIVVDFGKYNSKDKRTMHLEKKGIKIFNIEKSEDIFSATGRLIFILKNNSV